MTFYGADTEALRGHGQAVARGGQSIDELFSTLSSILGAVRWVGPDADAFRDAFAQALQARVRPTCEELRARAETLGREAEEQDSTSEEDGGGSGGAGGGGIVGGAQDVLEALRGWLDDYEPLESDGFFNDLFGENGTTAFNIYTGVTSLLDLGGMLPIPGLTQVGMATDLATMEIAKYDMIQSFQDGEFFNTADAAITYGINGLDVVVGAIGTIPTPPTVAIGEVGGIVTGGLDLLWNGATALAVNTGWGGGSPSRMLLEAPGNMIEALTGWDGASQITTAAADGIESAFSDASQQVRDAVPILDPLIDIPQRGLEGIRDLFS